MIGFVDVGFTYPDSPAPALRSVDFRVAAGDLALVIGPTGAGKTTLLKAVNGLVPRFSGGRLTGRVEVAGTTTSRSAPRELADRVGFLPQDVAASFIADTVEREISWTLEQLGASPDLMRRRVESTLDLMHLHEVAGRSVHALSSGQRQRVALAAILAAQPSVLVLDEPTSALDPLSAEEVLAALNRLVHDLGVTVLMAEHRLDRVTWFADQVVVVHGDGRVDSGPPAVQLGSAPVASPLTRLARVAGWDLTPVSVREARRSAGSLVTRLPEVPPPRWRDVPTGRPVMVVEGLGVERGPIRALDGVDLEVRAGDLVAVVGRNGAGKSTLLAAMAGALPPTTGRVGVDGIAPHGLRGRELIRRVGWVPSDPGLLLGASTVDRECSLADSETGLDPGRTRAVLDRLMPGLEGARHPRDLSAGQRLGLALAVVLAHRPAVLLLDEPTVGLDDAAKARLGDWLREEARGGTAVVFATHDMELVAGASARVVVLGDGEVIADGETSEIVVSSSTLAPQTARVLGPAPWLTPEQVAAGLAQGAR